MLSPLKHVFLEYRTLLVKIYSKNFVKPMILATEVFYELMVDIKCLPTLSAVLPLLEVMKTFVVFLQSPSVYGCDFTRALSLCISYLNGLYCTENAFISYAFSCCNKICDLSHESIRLRWHLDMNGCVKHLVFEAHFSTSVGSHFNVTCIDHVTHMRSFVTIELFDITISEVKVEVASTCLFFVLFVCLCFYIS